MSDDNIEATGTAGAGTSWSHPLATETADGARIVYVAVPNEDTLAIAKEHYERKSDQEPRLNAINAAIAARGVRYGEQGTPIEDIIRDAKKVEKYIRTGAVGPKPDRADKAPKKSDLTLTDKVPKVRKQTQQGAEE